VTRYAALLRAVNVGGSGKVSMAELRRLFESLGNRDVVTYIQSGNVVFSADQKPNIAHLEEALRSHLGIETSVVLRDAEQLNSVIGRNPFPAAPTEALHVAFIAGRPPKNALGDVGEAFLPEAAVLLGTEVYMYLPNGIGRSKLPAYVQRLVRLPATTRNWRTVNRLAELVAAIA
jgi:uncharacterized protein (DUF1697 family)